MDFFTLHYLNIFGTHKKDTSIFLNGLFHPFKQLIEGSLNRKTNTFCTVYLYPIFF